MPIPPVAECVKCHSVIRWKDSWGGDPSDDSKSYMETNGWAICLDCVGRFAELTLEHAKRHLKMGVGGHGDWYNQEVRDAAKR